MNLAKFVDFFLINLFFFCTKRSFSLAWWLFCDVFPHWLVDGHMVQSDGEGRFEDGRFFLSECFCC